MGAGKIHENDRVCVISDLGVHQFISFSPFLCFLKVSVISCLKLFLRVLPSGLSLGPELRPGVSGSRAVSPGEDQQILSNHLLRLPSS